MELIIKVSRVLFSLRFIFTKFLDLKETKSTKQRNTKEMIQKWV